MFEYFHGMWQGTNRVQSLHSGVDQMVGSNCLLIRNGDLKATNIPVDAVRPLLCLLSSYFYLV